jgi:hypothetical protein
MNNTWNRKCSECNKELFYSNKSNFQRSGSGLCLSCYKKGTRHHLYGKNNPKKGKIYSKIILDAIINKQIWYNENENVWYRICPSCNKNIKASSASKATNRIKCLCYSCVSKRRKYSDECRQKMKISAIKRIKTQGGVTTFNKKACSFIENCGNKLGYKFQHALNGGELWIDEFSLDGYDKEKKIAFEYDEPYHEKRKHKFLDIGRTKKRLKSGKVKEVIRYSHKYNKLYKSFPTYSIPI